MWHNEGTKLYFDKGDLVRFRVEEEEWQDQSPTAPPAKTDTTTEIERKVPFSLVVGAPPVIDRESTDPFRLQCAIQGWEMSFGGESKCTMLISTLRHVLKRTEEVESPTQNLFFPN